MIEISLTDPSLLMVVATVIGGNGEDTIDGGIGNDDLDGGDDADLGRIDVDVALMGDALAKPRKVMLMIKSGDAVPAEKRPQAGRPRRSSV